jgi:uncharacterized protein (TIGR02466 family)
MQLEVTTAFPTFVGRLAVPDADAMNHDLRAVILENERLHPTVGRSNIGGWHSRADFLERAEPAVAALTTWITWAVSRMVEASAGAGAVNGRLLLSAWATVCRSGAYHAPHCHPDSAWSGVYYVDAGAGSREQRFSGMLEFLDPRAGAETVSAPGDPYGMPLRVAPESGLLVVFPGWLYHWVHPYTGAAPRIAVSFNAALAAVDTSSHRDGSDHGTQTSEVSAPDFALQEP